MVKKKKIPVTPVTPQKGQTASGQASSTQSSAQPGQQSQSQVPSTQTSSSPEKKV